MRGSLLAVLLLSASACFAPAADPAPRPRASNVKLDAAFDPPPVMVPKSGFAVYVPPPDVKAVEYVALDGEEPFPAQLVGGSPTAFVFFARGLPEKSYRFIGVASDATGNLTRKPFVVQVGEPVVTPPPKKDAPGKDPPAKSDTYYFLVIRPDGPATSHFTKIMADPAWATLRAAGHRVKDKSVSDAAALGHTVPSDVSLPAVITLIENDKTSTIARSAIALPTTSPAILDLPKGVK